MPRPRFSCARALLELPEADAAAARARLEALAERLRATYGLPLRDDSLYAFNYATGRVDDREVDVMVEMAAMQWISKHTQYQALCERTMRAVATRAKRDYGLHNWSRLYETLRLYVPELVKMHCVARMGGLPELQAPEQVAAL